MVDDEHHRLRARNVLKSVSVYPKDGAKHPGKKYAVATVVDAHGVIETPFAKKTEDGQIER